MTRFRMFIDDTGSVHNAASNHPQQRFGGVVGVIFDLDYLRGTFEPSFDLLRERHFGRRADGSLPVLHLRNMKRADPRGSFAQLCDPVARSAWEASCISMFRRASYSVISVGVDKIAFYHRHPDWTGSIYELLVGTALARYGDFLQDKGLGDVVAEATNSSLDDDLRRLYRRLHAQGANSESSHALRRLLTSSEIKIKPKHKNIIGLQMADLLASTCFNHMKRIYADGPEFGPFGMRVADVIEAEKFLRCPRTGAPNGFGRIWKP